MEFYQQNSLESSFPELDTVLELGYKDAVRQSMNNVTSKNAHNKCTYVPKVFIYIHMWFYK